MDAATNPLLINWDLPFGMPPYGQIRAHHFRPALEQAMREHLAEVAAIANDPSNPNFENTIAALDRSGDRLGRIEAVFHGLGGSYTSPELQAALLDMAAPASAHWSQVQQNAALFARLDAVHEQRHGLALSPEQLRLVERMHRDFVRAGAKLPPPERARYAELLQQLAQLTTQFGQNVLHDENAFALPLPDAASQAGLPASLLAAARQAAADRGLGGTPVITLARSLIVPFLTFSTRRDLREHAWRAWVGRGENDGPSDNRGLAVQILQLRREQARLLGHVHYAELNLVDTMARSTDRVWSLLDEVWQRALPALDSERALLKLAMAEAGASEELAAWDWRYWAERVRQSRYALDDAEVKPYFALPNMVSAAFDCAGRLFGLTFQRRDDLQAHHPDVVPYEVRDAAGGTVGLFLHDNFSRPEKRSGAWMSALRWQHRNAGAGGAPVLPVIVNNNNFAKPAPGEQTLLALDEVRTLFHEFGHGLHGLLSDVGYSRLSGTKVLRDFVELPSQLFEHWGEERSVLRRHARHHRTGQPMPEALMDRIEAARKFGSAWETVRYTASAIVDMAAHQSAEPVDDIVAFEARVMSERGLPPEVGMNHRLPHFQHLFAGSGYAAGYYVYLWAEVLDADAFDAFVEAGDPFDADVAARLKRCIYSRGDSVEPGATYRAFRGRDAVIEPMLRGRGLIE
jgi:peptidyl-dipeptidase Dcp